ncbi:MAG: hypothetical protein RRY99_09550 [Flavobacterium sp.]
MREFYLINKLNEKWNLNKTDSFFHDPVGLGQEHKVKYEQIGTSFQKTEDFLKQKIISGKIKFSGYEAFEKFSKFIQYKPLILEYSSSDMYHIDVSIDKIEKKELETLGLIAEIQMKSLGTFYKKIEKQNVETNIGKRYDYKYKYTYSDTSIGVVEIDSDSTLLSKTKITILGPCINPTWKHNLNGLIVADGRINSSIAAGHRAVIDSIIFPYEIAEYDENGRYLRDLYQMSDFSTKRFINLQCGKNRISVSQEGSGKINFFIEGRIEYESV